MSINTRDDDDDAQLLIENLHCLVNADRIGDNDRTRRREEEALRTST